MMQVQAMEIARVGTEASHEEQLQSMCEELLNIFPQPVDTLSSRRKHKTAHSVKIIGSHHKIQEIVGPVVGE